MNVHSAPIGVCDSGLGGLSVVRELRALLPGEPILYYADSAYCPYGARPPAEVRARTLTIARALVARGAKLLVVACNTASSVALEAVRERCPVPVIGLEPAVKPAATRTRTGRIAVLATPRTCAGERLASLIDRYARGVMVLRVPGHGLTDLVEAGAASGSLAVSALRPLVTPLLERDVDTVVLGCTHYPFLTAAIRAVAGPSVTLVDSGEAVGRRVQAVLDANGIGQPDPRAGRLALLTSGDAARVAMMASRLLDEPVTAIRLPL